MSAGNARVMVAVRVRPVIREGAQLQNQEKFELQAVYRTSDTSLRVESTKPNEPVRASSFTFDYIFDQDSTQLEVYEDCVVDMVEAALVGINGTMLAYGQTGSGKTFTVLGDVKPNPLENDLLTTNSGMFLRVLSDLMEYKQRQLKKGWHVVVALSCVEVYNTSIRDLFGGKPGSEPPTLKPIMLGDDVLLPALIIKEMTTLHAVLSEIQLAISRRKSRDTDANSGSSRSHCLFTVDIMQQATSAPAPTVEILQFDRKNAEEKTSRRTSAPVGGPMPKRNGGGAPEANGLEPWEMPFQGTIYRVPGQKEPVYMSKIILADLAGSERIARTHVTGAGLAEATAINSSLTALGNVVHSLHEGSFVGYRDSSLTRLLKPTFSQASSRVFLIAQCSPTQLTFDETISTLHFANKVKAMKVSTTSGVEAEKLQFDYLELEKIYDGIVSDLRVFAVQEQAQPAVIRRKLARNRGLYYDAAASGKGKISSKDRYSALEAMGATHAAQQERQAILAARERESALEAERTNQAVQESCRRLFEEYKTTVMETQAAVKHERELTAHSASQKLLVESAAAGNQIVAEEGAGWAALMAMFMRAHQLVCKRELKTSLEAFDSISKDIARMSRVIYVPDDPETMKINSQYALAAWGHCTAKRFFSSCMEKRELQMLMLSVTTGNAAVEKWRTENANLVSGFEAEAY